MGRGKDRDKEVQYYNWVMLLNVGLNVAYQGGHCNLDKNLALPTGTVACAVILATGTVEIGCLRW